MFPDVLFIISKSDSICFASLTLGVSTKTFFLVRPNGAIAIRALFPVPVGNWTSMLLSACGFEKCSRILEYASRWHFRSSSVLICCEKLSIYLFKQFCHRHAEGFGYFFQCVHSRIGAFSSFYFNYSIQSQIRLFREAILGNTFFLP